MEILKWKMSWFHLGTGLSSQILQGNKVIIIWFPFYSKWIIIVLIFAKKIFSFKPTYLPEDNPAEFSYFFDTSRRRTCYIAPERFKTRTITEATNQVVYLQKLIDFRQTDLFINFLGPNFFNNSRRINHFNSRWSWVCKFWRIVSLHGHIFSWMCFNWTFYWRSCPLQFFTITCIQVEDIYILICLINPFFGFLGYVPVLQQINSNFMYIF